MEGGDANPGDKRENIVMAAPKSFNPEYGVSTTKSAGDAASADFKAKGAAINAAGVKAKAA